MQLMVPATRIKEVLLEIHNGGSGAHFGIYKTLSKIKERCYSVRCRDDATSRAGARNVRPARRSRDRELEREGRCKYTTSVRLSK